MCETMISDCDCTGADKLIVSIGQKQKVEGVIPWYSRTRGVEYQEEKFGKGNRLHNVDRAKKTKTCTVCGKRKVL